MAWQTQGREWKDGYWVQNYLQQEDPRNPGKYMGMTCNAEYDRPSSSRKYSNNVVVRNFYGGSLSIRDAGSNEKWDEYGT